MADGEEKRGDDRKPIELKVEYQRLNAFFADYTKNISRGGTFIQTESPLPIGTEFLFKLFVPKLEAPLEILGEVKWIQTLDDVAGRPSERPGMGIRFIYSGDTQRQEIADSVEGLMVESLGKSITEQLIAEGDPDKKDDEDDGANSG